MSEWNKFKPNKDDISFSDDKKEMHIWFESNYNGNVYLEIDMEIIKNKLKELDKK